MNRAEPADTGLRTLSVVIPVYWNEQSLPDLEIELASLEEQLGTLRLRLELVFVDDGSGDSSLERLLEMKRRRPESKVVTLARNFGAVAASKTGLQYVTGDCFTILAADLQDPISQIILMVEHWRAGSKFVISARAKRRDPLLTRVFAALYYRLVEWLVVKGYPEGGFDLMLMDRSMLRYMAGSGKNTNPSMYAFWLGFSPTILTYKRGGRRHGKSRWTFRKKLNLMIDTISGFSVAPIRLMSLLGLVVALASFIYGLNIMVQAFIGNVPAGGFATLAVLIFFFSGLILMTLGVLGEYLWRIFDAVSHKPESVIDQEFL